MLSRKDYEKFLKSLPDVADKAQAFDLTALDSDGDDFDTELEDEERHAPPPPATTDGESASAEDDDLGDEDDDLDEEDDDDEA
jgi:hypothetical protein